MSSSEDIREEFFEIIGANYLPSQIIDLDTLAHDLEGMTEEDLERIRAYSSGAISPPYDQEEDFDFPSPPDWL